MKNKKLFKYLFFVVGFLTIAAPVSAAIQLPSVLSDHMVLQQQTSVKLWGGAGENCKVSVKTSWDGKTYHIRSDSQGNWQLLVRTPKAGGPYRISFKDGEERVLENVMIGEVWFCSGQSNMEMPMRGFDRQPVKNSTDVIAKAKASTPIRMFTTDSEDGNWVRQFSKVPRADCTGRWMINTPENVANTSAAAYHFARYLQETLDVPVGLIISSWGGSKVEAWMSREAISPFGDVDLSILNNGTEVKNPAATPCVLYNAKIAPFLNFSIKGFLWYQGESNRENYYNYRALMSGFVKDLRSKWGLGDFPFYYVQIAPFNYEGADGNLSAMLQEAQSKNMRDISNSGMVTTLDIGSPVFIHPMDKKTVGKRLAYWALGNTYHVKGISYKPAIYQSMEISGSKIYINFSNAPHGVSPMWTALEGFEIAGVDKVFYPAEAGIETKTGRLAVFSENVSEPVAVRYAFKNFSQASLFGLDGIPVAPFRTDNW